jgi:phosphoribosylamine--glycine ligase
MQVLVIGSGGREHALAWKSSQDKSVSKVFVAPGNAGTALEPKIENLLINTNDFVEVERFCKEKAIGLVIIGPEQPLVDGMSDYLQSKGINTFGPSQAASQLEGSKTFSKDFFIKYDIPTAAYAAFDSYETSINYLDDIEYPTVVKADGLAAGKGVIICQNKNEAISALDSIFKDQAFGEAGSRVVIEEFLEGEEASFIAVVSKDKIVPLATSQDHKAVGEGDVGLNTGGMGAYSPAPIVDDYIHKKIIDEVMTPTMAGLISEGSPYLGFLYAGLMIKDGELKVLEFNCRFGDPETQPILLRLKSSLVDLCLAAINDDLDSYQINWTEQHSCGVVIASAGYPENYISNKNVQIYPENDQDMKLFHAGTKLVDGNVVTSGGRVFCATALGSDLKEAQSKAYNLVNKVSFEGAFCRNDIGFKGIK